MIGSPFLIHLAGIWSRSQVQIDYYPTDYIFPEDFARRSLEFWQQLIGEGRRRVFNGALCRLENFSQPNGRMQLSLSRTCYRDLLFSNAHTAELLRELGESGPVRALGISAVIETADGQIPIIRRSEHLGEGSGGLDVIGGHVHPDDHCRDGAPDVFFAIADEVQAELGVPPHLLHNMICCGLAENWRHRKPELIFYLSLPLTMNEVRQLSITARESDEFTELLAVSAQESGLRDFIEKHHTQITSSAHACLHLFRRIKK
ncbi:MAG: hypothetical protein ONA90_07925 [candidate division KSB1 bacterium]|nr:hypothetical protein [candidate division KSB1 bacterium]